MGIERNVSKPKGKVNRRRQKKITVVQKLYETCKEVFADCGPGVIPSPDKVERLKAVLGLLISLFRIFFFFCIGLFSLRLQLCVLLSTVISIEL